MVTFKGLSLKDAAPVRISNIYVESPKVATTIKERPVARGENFVRRKYSPRLIIIEFYFPQTYPTQKAQWFQRVSAWTHSNGPQELRLPNFPGKFIKAACTALPDLSAISKMDMMQIEFTAFDPAFVSETVKTAACGASFTVGGDLPALAYIQKVNASPISSPAWVLDSSHTIALSGTIASGTLKVDLEDKVITLNGTPIMDKMTLQSRFFEIEPGTHTVTGTGDVYIQERWL